MDFEYLFALLCSGVVKGSIYALIALGYTMVYGIIQLINFAHGEIYMVGAFVALIITGVLTLSGYSGLSVLVLAAVIAVIYAAAYGYTLEKIAYRPLRNAPRLSPLRKGRAFPKTAAPSPATCSTTSTPTSSSSRWKPATVIPSIW